MTDAKRIEGLKLVINKMKAQNLRLISENRQLRCNSEQKWIPVTERLPEERKIIIGSDVFVDPSEEVLVQMKSGWMHVTRYWGSRERYKNHPWIDLNYPTTDEVIAWMPKPESYKAESEGKE